MTARQTEHTILPLFTDRWSPRAFDPKPVDDATLMSLFEAARWAPSALNIQPWRFVYAKREDANWAAFLEPLMPGNRIWAAQASALVYVVSDTMMDYKGERHPSHSNSFDTGAAWMALALQARSMGLITHGMTGVDFDRVRRVAQVPDDFRIEAAVAIGYPGDKATLPEELQQREAPNGRRPVGETIFHGTMAG